VKLIPRLAIVVALLALPAIALAAIPPHAILAPNCTKAQYKPHQIMLACNDGTDYLTKLQWTRWNRRKAVATGINEVDNCKPDCARGHFHAYPVKVTLSRPHRCTKVKRHKVFGHIVLSYPGAHPGRSATQSGPLFCPF
jgi:hypothetical protein